MNATQKIVTRKTIVCRGSDRQTLRLRVPLGFQHSPYHTHYKISPSQAEKIERFYAKHGRTAEQGYGTAYVNEQCRADQCPHCVGICAKAIDLA